MVTAAALTGSKGVKEIIKTAAFLKKIPKTDTHVHLFDLGNLSYSWLKNAPEINRSFSIEDFQAASKNCHIGKILFIVAKKYSNNIFILDHMANPDIKTGDTEFWKKGIRALSELPNVICKISGIITRIGKDWTRKKIEPYILYVIEQFGMDRLVYGGDWPVVLRAGSYESWSKVFEKITAQFSKDELHKIYHENADRVYNL